LLHEVHLNVHYIHVKRDENGVKYEEKLVVRKCSITEWNWNYNVHGI